MVCTVLWQGTIPDPAGTGTALPFARVGEAIIKAPVEDVANLWWFFNLRKVRSTPWGYPSIPMRTTGVEARCADEGSGGDAPWEERGWVIRISAVVRCSQDWDKANTLASEVVEEYNSATRLVYIKGAAG